MIERPKNNVATWRHRVTAPALALKKSSRRTHARRLGPHLRIGVRRQRSLGDNSPAVCGRVQRFLDQSVAPCTAVEERGRHEEFSCAICLQGAPRATQAPSNWVLLRTSWHHAEIPLCKHAEQRGKGAGRQKQNSVYLGVQHNDASMSKRVAGMVDPTASLKSGLWNNNSDTPPN